MNFTSRTIRWRAGQPVAYMDPILKDNVGVNLINVDDCFNFAKEMATAKMDVKRTNRTCDDVTSGSGDHKLPRHGERLQSELRD